MTIQSANSLHQLHFVACASNADVLQARLLASPCLKKGRLPLTVYFNATSAAAGFNASMAALTALKTASSIDAAPPLTGIVHWLVWVHQDVVLPRDWDTRFLAALTQAAIDFPNLAVAGVYGVAGNGQAAVRAGHVLDRGTPLHEAAALPCLVDSLDELLFAVRVDAGLLLDPQLGFDFYATDLVLQAQAQGLACAVIDGYCEHWSTTPSFGAMPAGVVERIAANGRVFEAKWQHRLPVTTPCFDVTQAGDIARSIDSIVNMTAPGMG